MSDGGERARWNARFGADGYLFGTRPNAFLASQGRQLKPGQRALAVADGEGRNGVWLANQGLDVLSIDFSPVSLAKVQKLATETGAALQTECVDVSTWHWPGQHFDIVAAIFIQFAPPPLRTILFQGMKDALKPGGLILLVESRSVVPAGPLGHSLSCSVAIIAMFRQKFHLSSCADFPGHLSTLSKMTAVRANWPAYAKLSTVASAGQSAASYTTNRDTTR